MSACAMLSYNGVTPTAWQCGISSAARYGVTITTNAGSATASGFTIAWNYDPTARTLSIQCTDGPLLVPCWLINRKINEAVEACLNQETIELVQTGPN
jgi:hypothetical protein